MVGCCVPDVVENSNIFVPTRKRWCTDILCLLIFIVFCIGFLAVGIVAIINGDARSVVYPRDFSGQFCGSDIAVLDRPFGYFPRLDQDINEALIAGVLNPTNPAGFASFRPYTLCVKACPNAFSLKNPQSYGGASYPYRPGEGVRSPGSYYATIGTTTAARFCLPSRESRYGGERDLCGDPPCTDSVVQALGGSCTRALEEGSGEPMTAWEPKTTAQLAYCKFLVTEKQTVDYQPPDKTAATDYWERQFAYYIDQLYGLIEDIVAAWATVVVAGIALPFGLGLVWFVVLYLFAGLMVYLSLLILFAMLVAACFVLYAKAGLFSQNEQGGIQGLTGAALANATAGLPVSETAYAAASASLTYVAPAEDTAMQTLYTAAAVVTTLCLILFVIAIILLRKQIVRCVAIVKESTAVFRDVPFLMVWPLVGTGFCVGILIYGLIVSQFIVTQSPATWAQMNATIAPVVAGNANANTKLAELNALDPSTRQVLFMLIHVFGVIWLVYFTQACTYTTYASVPSVWYFSHENGELPNTIKFGCGVVPLLCGAWRVISKHLGTMAFGSLTLAVLTFIRLLLEYLDKKTKKLQEGHGGFVLRLMFCCVKCFLFCLHRTLKYLVQHSYIYVAIKGDSFCAACFAVFGLIGDSGGQLMVNRMVGGILALVITLSIPSACAVLCFAWLDNNTAIPPTWPAFAVFVCGLVIANGIAQVFKCVIDTIFVSAHMDMAANHPAKHMSSRLREAFDLRDVKRADPATPTQNL